MAENNARVVRNEWTQKSVDRVGRACFKKRLCL